jgi:HK97 family phage prohead protease
MELTKSLHSCHIKAVNSDEGILEAVVSVFNNVDSVGDRVLPGFFEQSLKGKMPKGVWMHDWNAPVAKTLEARELYPNDPLLPDSLKGLGGLYVKAKFNQNTQRGREAFSDIKEGIIDEFSIGYSVQEDRIAPDGARELVKGTLFEWSPVLFGANPQTAIVSAKGLTQDIDDVGAEVVRLVAARLSSLVDALQNATSSIKELIDSAKPKSARAQMEMQRLRALHNSRQKDNQ